MLGKPARLDRDEGDIHPFGDPHIQTDPRNIARVAVALAQRMADLDHANAAVYQGRYQQFAPKCTAAIARWEKDAAPLQRTAVSPHRPPVTHPHARRGPRGNTPP